MNDSNHGFHDAAPAASTAPQTSSVPPELLRALQQHPSYHQALLAAASQQRQQATTNFGNSFSSSGAQQLLSPLRAPSFPAPFMNFPATAPSSSLPTVSFAATTNPVLAAPLRAPSASSFAPTLKRSAESLPPGAMGLGRLGKLQRRGSNSTVATAQRDNPAMQQKGMKELQDAMNLVQGKAAYLTALQKCPELVQTESDAVRFLRYTSYNYWEAASLLAKYWKQRVDLFGEERAYLPLTLSGSNNSSALTPQDVEAVKSGALGMLPNDTNGRSVLYFDSSKQQATNLSLQARLRAAFYTMNVLCENTKSQTKGWVLLAIPSALTALPCQEMVTMLKTCFPTYCDKLHIVNATAGGLGHRLFFEAVLPLAMRALLPLVRDSGAGFHVGSTAELLRKLADYGLMREHLPQSSIDGLWTEQDFAASLEQRKAVEAMRYGGGAPPVVAAAPPTQRKPKKKKKATLEKAPSSKMTPVAVASAPMKSAAPKAAKMDPQMRNCLKQMSIAITQMPQHTQAYKQAKANCPKDVMEKQASHATFLRRDKYNVWLATRRCAQYWETRLEIFGGGGKKNSKQAFLPIDQTGEGALDRRDLAALGSGFLMTLPHDKQGRAVVFCDGSRLARSTAESRKRCAFYIYSIAAETIQSQTNGFVLLYALSEPNFDGEHKDTLRTIMSALPCRMAQVHVLQFPASDDKGSKIRETDPSLLHLFTELSEAPVMQHSATSRAGIAPKLVEHGLNYTGIPKSIGGKFGFDSFSQWQELRTRWEWNLPAGVSHNNNNDEDLFTSFDFSHVKPLTQMTEAEKTERKRKLNVIHSRRKRERERIEIEVLNEQCTEEQENKSVLMHENQRLIRLNNQAVQIVKEQTGQDVNLVAAL